MRSTAKLKESAAGFVTRIRLRGQAVKTSPFHGGNTGSIPVGVIIILKILFKIIKLDVAKW